MLDLGITGGKEMEEKKYRHIAFIWIAAISVTIPLLGCGILDDDPVRDHYDFEVTAVVRELLKEPVDGENFINLPGIKVQFTADKLWEGVTQPECTLNAEKITNDAGTCDWLFGYDLAVDPDIEGDVREYLESVLVTVYASRDGMGAEETIAMNAWKTSATVLLYLDPKNPQD
jgi:hypothetical protein